MKAEICSFGEVLLRFSPAPQGEWIRQGTLPVFVGGAELNVATALARWDLPVAYCSALPRNPLADDIIDYVESRGIDPTPILRSGQRIGSYYLTQGGDLKQGGVHYDRNYSSFSDLDANQVDWQPILQDKKWLHLSAISPALNAGVARACKELVVAASERGITISMDLNHRAQLWNYGSTPAEVMPDLVEHCDVVMGNIWSAHALLGIPLDTDIHAKGKRSHYVEHAQATAEALQSRFPRCKVIANTFRFDAPPTGLRYFATLDVDGKQYVSPELQTPSVVDKIGSGDCFMAGLMYGLYHQHAPQEVIDFAANAAFGKLQEKGDATQQTVDDIQNRMAAPSPAL
ncbi:sugar kinase [Persicitalea jodogahamensis]|uniref:2-dehydro-3-deoxygluconokinase n=1 Tax=Persicitalea jodogahamensis TaxID=402147 RepID=A0A8J3DD64_9BACT|nr:sugar kinase [Persicitalea jodogahamensis]GHB84841.1 2-dehydro-3-deoxygluconokinase [Persicitalea jodogahamensis]